MAYELNKKLKGIEPYSPINENYAVRLDANESCFNIGDKLGDVIADAVRNIDFNRYPDSAAELVTKGFAGFYGISPEKCTAGNGSDELISIILGAFLEKGDTVLTLSPDFSLVVIRIAEASLSCSAWDIRSAARNLGSAESSATISISLGPAIISISTLP